eukprot:scaffold1190_cov393-Prasinococcus_capsulatus_cf.AAC.36
MGMNQERLSGDNPLLGKAALTGLEVPTDIVAQIRSLMKAVDWIEQVREPEAWTPDWMYEVDLITAREYLNQGKTFLYNLIMIKAGALRVLNSLHGKLSALLEVERSYYKLARLSQGHRPIAPGNLSLEQRAVLQAVHSLWLSRTVKVGRRDGANLGLMASRKPPVPPGPDESKQQPSRRPRQAAAAAIAC